MDLKELSELVREMGIAGAGGAGFPMYAKLDKRADTLLLNCAECEPLLKVHRQLLEKYSYEIMNALTILAKAVEATRIIIAVKNTYTKTIDSVKSNLDSYPNIELKQFPEVYPLGDEVALIYEALGKVVPPGGLPIEVGVTVFNVETVYQLYRGLIAKEPVTSKYLTIAGEVKAPITIKVPLGLSVEEAVGLAGGPIIEAPVYLMGGPMTGSMVRPFDTITKTTNAIIVLPSDHYVIRKRQSDSSIDMKRAMAACCQCELCTDLCPRHELGHPITPHKFMRAATSVTTKDLSPFLDTMFCCGCGICEMYACPQELSPRKLIMEYKNGLRRNGIGIPKGNAYREVSPLREYRKVPLERLIGRLGLHQYDIDAPLRSLTIEPTQVRLNLNQHIGAKAIPVVHKGAFVKQGDLIATWDGEKLSLPVHASIDGQIMEVQDNFILIKNSSK